MTLWFREPEPCPTCGREATGVMSRITRPPKRPRVFMGVMVAVPCGCPAQRLYRTGDGFTLTDDRYRRPLRRLYRPAALDGGEGRAAR